MAKSIWGSRSICSSARLGLNDLLGLLGIDGILIDNSIALIPKPATEWPLVYQNPEGRVYQRAGASLPHRSTVTLPNEKSASATCSRDLQTRGRK